MKTTASDFPDWFGPMLVKELRQGLKTRAFVLSFVGLQLVLMLVLFFHILVYARDPKDFDPTSLSIIFWMLIGGLLLLVTPLRAFNELSAERKANTLELIFMSGLSAWRITFGKWVSLLFQAVLFLLAVLPYAILRYYFGSVDLTEDLTTMLIVLLCCALLSAAALAISGMALWVRVTIAVVAGMYLLVLVPMMAVAAVARPAALSLFGGAFGGAALSDVAWWLVAWDAVLLCLLALEIGAATVAPPAENHAGRQRFLALLLWLPLAPMIWLKAGDSSIGAQLLVAGSVAGALAWYYLSTTPALLRTHCQPFAGWRAPFGLPFQPGWPSAVVFLVIVTALFEVVLRHIAHGSAGLAASAMHRLGAGALLCSTVFWRTLRRRSRFPMLEQTLLILGTGVLVALLVAGRPRDMHLADHAYLAAFPPAGLWALLDSPNSAPSEPLLHAWTNAAAAAFAGYCLLLLLLSRTYWAQYFRLCRAAGGPSAALDSPASPTPPPNPAEARDP